MTPTALQSYLRYHDEDRTIGQIKKVFPDATTQDIREAYDSLFKPDGSGMYPKECYDKPPCDGLKRVRQSLGAKYCEPDNSIGACTLDRVLKEYMSGWGIVQIATRHGIKRYAVERIIKVSGISREMPTTVQSMVGAFLADGEWRTVDEIGTAIGASTPAIRTAIYSLRRSGVVERKTLYGNKAAWRRKHGIGQIPPRP